MYKKLTNNKVLGFTLIELLAVIVILAIIATIATPIVLSIIEDTKESALLRSAEHYLNTVELGVAKKNLTAGGSFSPNVCEIQSDGNLLCDETETLEVELSGGVPSSGTITFDKGKIISVYELILGGKKLTTDKNGKLEIKEYRTYTVTYENIGDKTDLPTTVIEGNTLTVNLINKGISEEEITVKVNNEEINDYTYENYILTVEEVTGNIIVIGVEEQVVPEPVSFETDSWETIIANVKVGNTDAYNVGDTREIELSGFENGETDSNGVQIKTYTIRIANKTNTGDVCTKEYFEKADGTKETYSKTACGFVIEFEDIILNSGDDAKMNLTNTNAGGWENSKMRTYVNNTIYNALPKELKDVIIDTTVVSGYGSGDAPNKVTTDKVYLLSTGEVWEQGTSNTISKDTARENTRQLDYYKNYENGDGSIGVTTNNYSGSVKKYNGSAVYWWLRSAYSTTTLSFYHVITYGVWDFNGAVNTIGVAVAFRIG